MNLLLIIPPQLPHQLEGIHVAGTGASDLVFTQQYFHCKIRRCQDLTPTHNHGFKSERFPTIQIQPSEATTLYRFPIVHAQVQCLSIIVFIMIIIMCFIKRAGQKKALSWLFSSICNCNIDTYLGLKYRSITQP